MRKPRISQRSIRNRFNSRSSPLHNNTRWYESRPWRGGGDGSTLSLDFTTMSSLDSRLTFSRSSTATFINSSGLVQWTNANIVRRSEDCTNWGGSQNITPTADAAIAPNGTQTADQLNLSATSYRYQVTAASKVIGGQRYTGSIYVRAVSGTAQVNLRIANTADGNNGVAVTQTVGETWTRLQGSFTLASNGTLIDIGLDQRTGIPNAGPGVAANVYVWGLQLQPGGTAGEYLQTTTTENYNTARFDYDPTTLAPRGLLIEGSSSTLNQWSEDYTQSYWQKINTTISSTSVTCPDGVARSTVRVVDNSTNASHSIRRGITTAAGTTYTLSWFVKKGSTDTFAVQMYWSGSYNATVTVSSIDNNTQTVTSASGVNPTVTRVSYPVHGWYRYSMTFTHPAAITGTITPDFNFCPIDNVANYVGSGNHTDFFGIQLEAGSGASSYIPTGSSTVQRAADSCSLTGSNFSSWYGTPTAFTVVFEGTAVSAGAYTRILNLSSGANTVTGIPHFNIGVPAASSNRPFINSYIVSSNNVDTYVPLAGAVTNGVAFKLAARCQAALHRITRGTGLSGSSSYNGFPAGLANLYLGGTDGAYQLATWYSKLKFFPIAISDSQMDVLAT